MGANDVRALADRGTVRRYVVTLVVLVAAVLETARSAVRAFTSEASFRRCADRAGVDLGLPAEEVGNRLAVSGAFTDCRVGEEAWASGMALAFTGGVVVAALLLCLAIPVWRGRRLRPAERFDGGRPTWLPLTVHLERLVSRSELGRRAPVFVVDPRQHAAGAVVFGHPRRPTVCLGAGLLSCRARRQKAFEAVVLHELAHVRNGDIGITYFTVALWRVYCAAVLVPFLLLSPWLPAQEQAPAAGTLAPGLAAALLGYLSRAEVLRHRELVADFDAVHLAGAEGAVWRTAAEAEAEARREGWARAAGRWFAGLWRAHPSWEERHTFLTRRGRMDHGATGLQSALYVGALFTVLFTVDLTEGRAARLLFYAAVVALIAAAGVSMPRKRPRPVSLDGAGARAGGRTRPVRRLGVLVAAFCLLVAADAALSPFDGTGLPDAMANRESLPAEFRHEPPPPPAPAEVAEWERAGGRDVLDRLDAALGIAPALTFTSLPPEGDEAELLADHCAEIRAVVRDGRALRPLPTEREQGLIEDALTSAEDGGALLCADGRGPDDARAVVEADLHYTRAGTDLMSLRLTFLVAGLVPEPP
ncbi:M48 family metalloprotease [Streptomyces avicenniae]|uniref:M48 family metalloprotease n=1 Tax=Streptomyces avicenniae TaxID=500153 RepID=UPI00069B7C0E|nr:M48 family metalloprotease [Streptomyces avicenniae]